MTPKKTTEKTGGHVITLKKSGLEFNVEIEKHICILWLSYVYVNGLYDFNLFDKNHLNNVLKLSIQQIFDKKFDCKKSFRLFFKDYVIQQVFSSLNLAMDFDNVKKIISQTIYS